MEKRNLDQGNRLVAKLDLSWGRISQIAITPDGRFAIAACQDGKLGIWNLETDTQEAPLVGHIGIVEAVALTGDGRYVVSGSDDRTIRVWDWASRSEHCQLPAPGNPGLTSWIRAIAVSADGNLIVSGGYDGGLIVWNRANRSSVATFTGDTFIECCAVTADGRTVVAGEMSGWLHFLRLENYADTLVGDSVATLRGANSEGIEPQ